MGPNVLWLAEWASQAVPLQRGMRVLDLGCGKAASSIFLAKEFDVLVWAADLWIKPTDNWRRIEAAGLTDRVLPFYAEAHALPFAAGYFDVILSFDAYHYFGTDELYVGLSRISFARAGAFASSRQASPGSCRKGRPSGFALIGNGSSAASTAPAGGVGIGPRPGLLKSNSLTTEPTGGSCGRSGMSAARKSVPAPAAAP
jgi:SAM-dependent methyltransferase